MVKQERAVRTRETLIRSAAEIFDREGFTAASLTMISSRAGVSSGALHFHFASKAALADAVEAAAVLGLRAVTEKKSPNATSRLQRLVDVTHRFAQRLRDDVVLRAGFELSGDVNRVPRTDLRACWQEWVEETVRQAEDQGELCTGVAPESAVTAVVAATVGFEVLGARDTAWLSRRAITQFWQLLLPTLASVALLGALHAEGSLAAPEAEADGAICL